MALKQKQEKKKIHKQFLLFILQSRFFVRFRNVGYRINMSATALLTLFYALFFPNAPQTLEIEILSWQSIVPFELTCFSSGMLLFKQLNVIIKAITMLMQWIIHKFKNANENENHEINTRQIDGNKKKNIFPMEVKMNIFHGL